jgi:WD40 repeat protein
VNSVAFSKDGRTLATASDDQTVRLWDLSAWARPVQLGQPLTGHHGKVTSVAFSPDHHTLATASTDRTVRLWDIRQRVRPVQLGRPLTGHHDGVYSVAFSPDGHSLVSGSEDGTLVLWNLTELNAIRNYPLERACALTGRGLSHDEWTRYVPGLPYEDSCPNRP